MIEELRKRKKIWICFGVFLLFMGVSSVVAKGIYTSGLPQIETALPMKNSIVHEVSVQGIVKHNKEVALNLVSGLRIQQIYTREGTAITPETVLFQVDMEDLQEQIVAQERSIEKLNLQRLDIQTNQLLEAEKKETELKRAEEDYNKAGANVDKQITEADIAVHNAQVALEEHNKRKPGINEADKKSAEEAYANWSATKDSLTKAYQEAGIAKDDADKTKEDAKQALEEAEARGDTETILAPLRDALAAAVLEVDAKQQGLDHAKEALELHIANSIGKPDYSGIESQISTWEVTKKQLEQALKEAQKNRVNLGDTKKEALENAGRVVADTKQEERVDSSAQRYEIEIAEKKDMIKKYKEIYQQEGKIRSNVSGMVIACNASTGERTTDTPIVKIADTSGTESFEFQGTITKEQKNYVNLLDTGTLSLSGESEVLEVKIDYLLENPTIPNAYDITSILPEGIGYISESGTLQMENQSESYALCIPTKAVQVNDNGTYFVYELISKESILGTEMAVRMISVKVIDQNERYAAIQEGGLLDSQSEIVTVSTKELKEGASVRYKEW